MANHALEDVEVNGLVVSFGRDRPALVKPEQTEVVGGSSGEYRMLQEAWFSRNLDRASSLCQGLPEMNRPVTFCYKVIMFLKRKTQETHLQ